MEAKCRLLFAFYLPSSDKKKKSGIIAMFADATQNMSI